MRLSCIKGATLYPYPYPKSPGEEAMTHGEPRYGTGPVGQLLEGRPDEL